VTSGGSSNVLGACLDETTAARLLAGELEPEAAELAHRHAATCLDCQQFVAELARACVETMQSTVQPEVAAAGGELRRGAMVGRFLVLGRIGAGGMGVVHAAYDPDLDRRVALKLLRGEPSAAHRGDSRARLLREAQAAARLSHPNVVSVFDLGTFEDCVYLAMEYVDGVTLTEWLRGDHGWEQVVDVFVQAGRGIAAAHEAGVIHRDFKPDNVLIGRDGRARVVDFGLARAAGAEPTPAPLATDRDPDETQPASHAIAARLTQTGALLGTPRYMAPEQFAGGEITPNTDQFGFCVALYHALYRTPPFRGDRISEIASHVIAGEIQPGAELRGPAELRRALVRGLAVDPARRHPSMNALLGELERARSTRRRWYVGSALVAAVLAGGLALIVMTGDDVVPPCSGAASKVRAAWNADRAARARGAFTGHALPYGEAAWRTVEARLDRYANAWEAMRTEACEATHVDHEQSELLLDLRIACLDDRLAELTAFVGALETADADTARRSIQATDRLPALAPCADRAALAAPIRPPDAAIATQVAAVNRELAPVAALQRLGKVRPALDAAERVCTRTDALAYAPLTARCRYVVAKLVDQATGDQARTVELLTEAITAAIAGNDQRLTADAAVVLASVLGDKLGQFDEAERWARLAESAGAKLADRQDLAARLAQVRGLVAARRGRWPDALTRFEQLLALREQLEPGGLAAANAHVSVGHALVALGRDQDAEPHYRRALAVTEEVSGTTHPDLLPILDGLGQLQWSLGRHAAAVQHLERGLAITRATVASDHPSAIIALANLGAVLSNAGELDRALVHLEEARTTVRATDRRELGLVLTNLVLVHQLRGDHERASAMAEQALVVERETKGDDHTDTGRAYFNLGDTQLSRGRRREAVESLRKALAIWERSLPAEHPLLTTGRTALGDALVQAGDPRAAIPLLARVVAVHEAKQEVLELARARFLLARASWSVDRPRSLALAKAALDALQPTEPQHAATLAEVKQWLAARR
jgi:tetratricopeptide (TPR) repeat protein